MRIGDKTLPPEVQQMIVDASDLPTRRALQQTSSTLREQVARCDVWTKDLLYTLQRSPYQIPRDEAATWLKACLANAERTCQRPAPREPFVSRVEQQRKRLGRSFAESRKHADVGRIENPLLRDPYIARYLVQLGALSAFGLSIGVSSQFRPTPWAWGLQCCALLAQSTLMNDMHHNAAWAEKGNAAALPLFVEIEAAFSILPGLACLTGFLQLIHQRDGWMHAQQGEYAVSQVVGGFVVGYYFFSSLPIFLSLLPVWLPPPHAVMRPKPKAQKRAIRENLLAQWALILEQGPPQASPP